VSYLVEVFLLNTILLLHSGAALTYGSVVSTNLENKKSVLIYTTEDTLKY